MVQANVMVMISNIHIPVATFCLTFWGCHSNFFVIRKKDSTARPIFNAKPMNGVAYGYPIVLFPWNFILPQISPISFLVLMC